MYKTDNDVVILVSDQAQVFNLLFLSAHVLKYPPYLNFMTSLLIGCLSLAGGVSTDSPVCSDMSAEILRRGGSAVDASITALLCVGIVHAESSGIGGGGFMIVRETNGSVHAINFREAAPGAATVDMYHSDPQLSKTV